MGKEKIVKFPKKRKKKVEPRILQIGSAKHTIVKAMDEKGTGNANHHYEIFTADCKRKFTKICFQNGPIKEAGINGIHNEDLIAIVIDRFAGFQNGPYGCTENALAMIKLEESLHWLKHRTEQRERRGVEGTHEV